MIQSGGIKPHHSSIISITRRLIYISIESHQINDTHTIDRIKIAGGELFHFQSTDKESNVNVTAKMYDFRGIKTFYKILLESDYSRCLQEDRISLPLFTLFLILFCYEL